jgi:hypothetical protein
VDLIAKHVTTAQKIFFISRLKCEFQSRLSDASAYGGAADNAEYGRREVAVGIANRGVLPARQTLRKQARDANFI